MHNRQSKRSLFIPKQHRKKLPRNSLQWESSSSSATPVRTPSRVPPPFLHSYVSSSNPSISSSIDQVSSQQNISVSPMIIQDILTEIQELDFSMNFERLLSKFTEFVNGHVSFEGLYPLFRSPLGEALIRDGLFHEMWAKIAHKSNQDLPNQLYYQKYISIINKNQSNFESTFNRYSSFETLPLKLPVYTPPRSMVQMEGQSTNIFASRRNTNQIIKKEQERSREYSGEVANASHKQNEEPIYNKGVQLTSSGRLRLFGQIQTNRRRINAEIACHFLKIHRVYFLEDVTIQTIIECHFTSQQNLVVFKGHLESYNPQLGRNMIDYRPKLLIILYGEVSLKQLLRLKLTFGQFEGMVVYDQIFEIEPWLRLQGHLNDYQPPVL